MPERLHVCCREPLLRENPNAADAMEEEQTWPDEEEMANGGTAGAARRKLAPGTSDYQACWILDDEGEDDDGDEGEEDGSVGDDRGCEAGMGAAGAAGGDKEPPELVAMDDAATEAGGDMELDDEGITGLDLQEVQRLRAERRQHAAADDLNYPDEIETPHDVPAQVRRTMLPACSVLSVVR